MRTQTALAMECKYGKQKEEADQVKEICGPQDSGKEEGTRKGTRHGCIGMSKVTSQPPSLATTSFFFPRGRIAP